MMKKCALYLVTSEDYSRGRSTLDIAKEAISGGVDIIQMREKQKNREELLALGGEMLTLCRAGGVTFIVNDDPHLAKEIGAGGVHLGQEDMKKCSIAGARDILGKDKIIGVSTHSLDQFEEALREDVDYIAFGPIFPTKTKDYFLGAGEIEKILSLADKPVVFIGGITRSNMDTVLAKGASHIAVIRAITEAPDVRKETEFLKQRIANFHLERKRMSVKINGCPYEFKERISIKDIVRQKDLNEDVIVIEHNLDIVSKEEWPRVLLKEGDSLEIISFVGGG